MIPVRSKVSVFGAAYEGGVSLSSDFFVTISPARSIDLSLDLLSTFFLAFFLAS